MNESLWFFESFQAACKLVERKKLEYNFFKLYKQMDKLLESKVIKDSKKT
jgi:hypothetical protein